MIRLLSLLRGHGGQRVAPPNLLLLMLAVLISSLAGCGSSDSAKVATGDKDTQSEAGATKSQKCRAKLAAAIKRHAPVSFAMQANAERSINSLNSWLASCASGEVTKLSLDEAALALVDSNVRATAPRFTVNDATYIRDCLLLRDLTTAVSERSLARIDDPAQHDVAKVKGLFDWVIRNISLTPAGEQRPPIGLVDVLMTGRGTAEDRAWVLAEALRQQELDGFVVRPAGDPVADGGILETSPWLFAVALNDNSMLFDLTVGLPVTNEESGGVLAAVPEKIESLKNHDRWKDSSAEVIAQLSAFAPRMYVLQQELAVADSAVMFEELTGGVSEILPLVQRIEAAGDGLWPTAKISIWSYAETRVVASQSRTEDQAAEYARLTRVFEGPFERAPYEAESTEELTAVPEELSPEERRALIEERLYDSFVAKMNSSEEMFGTPSRRMLKTRLQQVMGADMSEVIQQLQQIRITGMEPFIAIQVPLQMQAQSGFPPVMQFPLPRTIRELNLSTTGSSLYWTAMQQLEVGDHGAAIATLVNYRRQYENGEWKYPAMLNQVTALLHQDRTDDAIELLNEANVEENPEQQRVRLLLQRLAD